ncbi:TonB-dependent receptor [Pseudodonghicola sp.]|uniref:TonB-dependent receptor n=1 Tax=Pseudodonghicola sp. TaxID=1969463 RepID=UPI003A96A6F7
MQKTDGGSLAQGVSRLSLVAALAAMAAAPAAAEGREDEIFALEPITVTGEKVDRDQKHTASSVSVISGKELEEEYPGKSDVNSVIADTPNLVFSDSVGTPVIRGQDAQGPHNGAVAFFAGTVPRATINLDGHYLSYNEFYFGATSVWDVQSVEVFRGPQTTSQGANAIAGAIVVNTKDPTFTPEGAYRFEIGNYGQKRASMAWSGPLSEQVAVRLALDSSGRDTFIDYTNPSFIQNEYGQNFKSRTARFKLLWAPVDIPGLEAKLTLSHSASDRPSQEAASEPYEQLDSIHASMPSWRQQTDTAVIDVNYDFFNGWRLFNQTQYSHSNVKRRTGITHGGDADVSQDNVSNEFRLSYGTEDDPLSGFFGLYYADTDQSEYLDLSGRYSYVDSYSSTFEDHKKNLGIYGELSWHPADRWTVIGGLRFQRDQIQRSGYSTYSPTQVDYDNTFSAMLPKLSVAYDISPDWTVGAMVSRGYNPGGVSLNFSNGEWIEFEEEKIWNYEIFTRASLLDDRLFLSGNLFLMDYKNGQFNIPVLVDSVYYTYTINAEKAQSYGAELAVDYQVTEALRLRASAGLLHTDLQEVSSNTAYEGNEFPKAPGQTFNVSASWDATDRLNLGGRVRYVDGYYSDTSNTAAYAVDGYTLVDLEASYTLRDGLELYGFVNNIFDERKPLALQAARGTSVFTSASMTSPRMIGIGIRGTF